MKLVYTEQSLVILEEALNFIAPKVSHEKLIEIRNEILDAADSMLLQAFQGRTGPYLEHLDRASPFNCWSLNPLQKVCIF